MRIKQCRNCRSNKLIKLFSLGNLCFTGKFSSPKDNIKKKPVTVVLCKSCELVQLAHNYNLKYLYGPDYGYRTGINKTMLTHVNKVVKNLSKMTKIKKNDFVLDIASNDGSLLNFYNKEYILVGFEPAKNIKFIDEGKNIKIF